MMVFVNFFKTLNLKKKKSADDNKLCRNTWYAELIRVKFALIRKRLTHISLASYLWDICKQYRPRPDATEHGV